MVIGMIVFCSSSGRPKVLTDEEEELVLCTVKRVLAKGGTVNRRGVPGRSSFHFALVFLFHRACCYWHSYHDSVPAA